MWGRKLFRESNTTFFKSFVRIIVFLGTNATNQCLINHIVFYDFFPDALHDLLPLHPNFLFPHFDFHLPFLPHLLLPSLFNLSRSRSMCLPFHIPPYRSIYLHIYLHFSFILLQHPLLPTSLLRCFGFLPPARKL